VPDFLNSRCKLFFRAIEFIRPVSNFVSFLETHELIVRDSSQLGIVGHVVSDITMVVRVEFKMKRQLLGIEESQHQEWTPKRTPNELEFVGLGSGRLRLITWENGRE